MNRLLTLNRFLKRITPPPVKTRILRVLTYFRERHALRLPSPGQPEKAALVSYVTAPFLQGSRSTLFTHAGIPKLMVRALHDLGYSVDLIEWNNTVFTPRKEYQLFIGHAGRNFERITKKIGAECTKIYFATGTYWKDHNKFEEQRFASLEKRRGVRLPYDRWINDSEEYANQSADGIICLGNHVARKSYGKFPRVLNLNNATYQHESGLPPQKDHGIGRANFLFLASAGNVHKGLDLLLEAFCRPELQAIAHLYICQTIRPDFFSLYQAELKDMPNIHLIGHIELQSPLFQELVLKCSFVIHPSCAEGQPGAVLDCMRYGLIPILTRENNIDLEDCGFTLSSSVPALIEEITETIQRLSQLPVEECRRLSLKTREVTAARFSEEEFYRHMKNSIQTIINSPAHPVEPDPRP